MDQIQRPDFSLKNAISPDAVMAMMSQKANREAEMKLQQRQQEFKQMHETIQMTGQAVSGMVEASKARAKRDFIESYSDMMAQKLSTKSNAAPVTLFSNPANGAVGPTEQTQVPTASFDPALFDAVKGSVKQAPDAFAKAMAQQLIPAPARGTTASGFTSPISVVNTKTGAKTFLQPGKDGSMILANGEPYSGDWVKDYALSTGKDQFNNPIVIDKVKREAQTLTTPAARETASGGGIPELQSKAPVLAERFVEARDRAFPEKNAVLKDAVNAASSAAQAKSLLVQDDKIEVGLRSLGFYFARASGSNSQLSDAEREQFESPLALLENYKNKGYRAIKGELSPVMKRDLVRLATLIERKNKLIANKTINAAKANAKAQVGSLWNESLSKEFPTVNDLVASSEEIGQIPANGDVGPTAQQQVTQGAKDIGAALRAILPKR